MVKVRVLGIARDSEGQHIVLLKPVGEAQGAGLILPIWIGEQEATSTLFALGGDTPPRPLTHDLMKTLVDAVGGHVERVDITNIEAGTFFAEITLVAASDPIILDARPSDSIALALRTGAPLFVADDVMDEVGIPALMVETVTDEEEELDEFKRFLEDVDPEDFQG